MRLLGIVFGLSSMACAALAVAPAVAAERGMIGVTTAATVVSTGTPPDRTERILEVGTDMFANERVRTSETGRAQLMFGDGSSLLIGPNSSLSLDKYIYDPDRKVGEIVLTATEGAFRYIGGFISKHTPVRFQTPAAIIGIRGGINQFTIDRSTGRVTTTHMFGIATTIMVPNGDGTTRTTTFVRRGFQAVISPGGRISFSRMTAAEFRRINALFERPANVALAGLPAAGGDPGAPIDVPTVGKLGSDSSSDLESLNATLASMPNDSLIPAIRSFVPPPPPAIVQAPPTVESLPSFPSNGP